MIYLLNKWGQRSTGRQWTRGRRSGAGETERDRRSRPHHLRDHDHGSRFAVGDVHRAELVLDDVPCNLRGEPVPDLLRILPRSVPLDGQSYATQGRDAAKVPDRHGHAAIGLHDVLVVYLVLPVHAGLGGEPAGRDSVLPAALRWRLVRRLGDTLRVPLRSAVPVVAVPRYQDAPGSATLGRGLSCGDLCHRRDVVDRPILPAVEFLPDMAHGCRSHPRHWRRVGVVLHLAVEAAAAVARKARLIQAAGGSPS